MKLQQKTSPKVESSEYQNQESWQVSTWAHRAWLAAGCATVVVSLAKSIILTAQFASASSWPWLQLMFAAFIGYVAADLGSGIYHWAIDNYGSAETPIFGSQIEDFQGHHRRPWAITKQQVARNLYLPAASVTVALLPINIICTDPAVLGFVGSLAGCVVFSQQFHAWSHTPKGKLPALVVAVQDAGIILGRVQHAGHHRPPYNSNYCIVSGVWSRFLDKSHFFVALEVVILYAVGVRPRSWSDPYSDWTEQIN